jgi:thioesterase domain-containing protein
MVNRGYDDALRGLMHRLMRWKMRAAANQVIRVAVGRTRSRTFKNLPAAPVPIPITLFTSSAPYSEARNNPDLGWGALCTGLEIVTLEGDHNDILTDERPGALADKLAAIELSLRPAQAA